MPKLSDTQAILLSTASRRDDGSLYPLPTTLADAGARVSNSISAMLRLALIEERETTVVTSVHRIDEHVRYGVFITDAGKAAIGVDDDETGDVVNTPTPAPAPAERPSKTTAVIALRQRGNGATTAELIAATGWLPHTTRAALTGLRKKGHTIDRSKRGDETCYRILAAA